MNGIEKTKALSLLADALYQHLDEEVTELAKRESLDEELTNYLRNAAVTTQGLI